MQNFSKNYKSFIILLILFAYTVIPFVDSMACDDLVRSTPLKGNGVEIKCIKYFGNNKSIYATNTCDQSSAGNDIHFFCLLCISISEPAYSHIFNAQLARFTFKSHLKFISLSEIAFPIDKPPQN